MPKATSKKKKFNARFPPARIKKIMQTDEEVGKVAAAVPVIISRALEMFIESLVTETSKVTLEKNAKTLSTSHIKQTITATKEFDFLRNLVENVPDHQIEDNERRGRPKSIDGLRKSKSKGNKTSSEEEDDDCDDDAEDTETDEESSNSWTSHPADMKPNTSFLPGAQPNVSYPQRSDIKPNIGHLIQAASTLQQQQQLNSFQPPALMQPPLPNNTMSHNNNNYVPSSAVGSASLQGFSVVRDSLISGKNTAPFLHHQGLPLSSDSVPTSILADFKPNLYQMPSNINSPPTSHFSSQLPSKVFYNNSGSNPLSSPPYLQSPVSEKLSQQYQPIDLSQPLRHNMNEQDDYDA